MGVNTIEPRRNTTTDATRLPSSAIWGDCPWDDIVDPRSHINGIAVADDFVDLPLTPTLTTQIAYGKYKAFASSSSTIAKPAGGSINSAIVPANALAFTMEATQTKSGTLSSAYSSFCPSSTAGVAGKLWFEACIATSSIAASVISFILGLAEVDASSYTLAVGLPLTDSTGTAFTTTGGFVGFNKIGTATTAVKTGYTDRAATLTQVGTNQVTLPAAYTFTKLGMTIDQTRSGTVAGTSGTCMIQFFQDNVLLGTGVTQTTWATLTNINANCMGMIFSNQTAAGTAFTNYLRWWRCAQLLL